MTTPKTLKARYPYQFEGPAIELSFFKGWIFLLAQLCADIDEELGANKRSFRWVQLKQKFGAARFYYRMEGVLGSDDREGNQYHLSIKQNDHRNRHLADPDEMALRQRIQMLKQKAESLTQTACIVCGTPGEIDHRKGVDLVVCPEHARQRQAGGIEPPWFADEDE